MCTYLSLHNQTYRQLHRWIIFAVHIVDGVAVLHVHAIRVCVVKFYIHNI